MTKTQKSGANSTERRKTTQAKPFRIYTENQHDTMQHHKQSWHGPYEININ